ncbi:hypothetical protein [Desulfatiglans anilini]|uniref:hypothetical protein n=1 Tax=Desulfatiglans anilini TaxID=90728 RepID=UPI00042051DB|nr:hypothetical protein [Desulfatiglans anilini]
MQIITDYAYALTTLDRFDHGTLIIEEVTRPAPYLLTYDAAMKIVKAMQPGFGGLFGLEKDRGTLEQEQLRAFSLSKRVRPLPASSPPDWRFFLAAFFGYPAILRWMIEGCLNWRENGLLQPESVKETTAPILTSRIMTLRHFKGITLRKKEEWEDSYQNYC